MIEIYKTSKLVDNQGARKWGDWISFFYGKSDHARMKIGEVPHHLVDTGNIFGYNYIYSYTRESYWSVKIFHDEDFILIEEMRKIYTNSDREDLLRVSTSSMEFFNDFETLFKLVL